MVKNIKNGVEIEGMGKKKLSEQHKKKIGLANSIALKKFHKNNPEVRKTMNERFKGKPSWNKGLKMSEESKKKMSLAKKGKPSSMKGKKHSEESIIKMRESKKNMSQKTRNRMSKAKKNMSEETKNKISKANKGRKLWTNSNHPMLGRKQTEKWKKMRSKLKLPVKDSSIELKIQDFLTLLEVEFVTHKYMNIKHSYQCDILIPVQDRISQKTIIECDGEFFHMNPKKYSANDKCFKMVAKDRWKLDESRTKELIEKGYRVIRIWENEIRVMSIDDLKEKVMEVKTYAI